LLPAVFFVQDALALVDPDSMELEIQTFENILRRIVAAAQKKADGGQKPS
jgi:hypothetical protein